MANQKFDENYEIISNKETVKNYFELKIKAPKVTKNVRAGQFFMLTVPDVFLRRPFSVHDANKDIISFLYKTLGRGTKTLSQIKDGSISALGPLGKGYLESAKKDDKSAAVLIAGGTGIASVYFLAKSLKQKTILFYGAKTKKEIVCIDKFKKLNTEIFLTTEDGSAGHKGFITDILSKRLSFYKNCIFYICGPSPMIKATVQILKENNLKGFASLEEKMACGIGNCQGCAVQIKDGIKNVCKDGPVFDIDVL